jgi:DNA-nicking Smr family endonuclease
MSQGPTPEDHALWQETMKGIKRLKRDSTPPVLQNIYPEKIIIRNQHMRQQSQEIPKAHFPVETITSREQKNIQLQGRIDLHGYTQEKAHTALVNFFSKAQIQGHKWVLVITGKGAVLQAFVPQWFENHSSFVISYSFAQPKDGGQGAFYVRVRKSRK